MLPILLGRTSQKERIFRARNYTQPEWVWLRQVLSETSRSSANTSVAGNDDTLGDLSSNKCRQCAKKPRYACTFHPESNSFSNAIKFLRIL